MCLERNDFDEKYHGLPLPALRVEENRHANQ